MKVYFNGNNSDKYFLIDKKDFNLIKKYKWYLNNRNYVVDSNGRRVHRIIMGVTDPKIKIDHIDGNTLNNCKSNLRVCSQHENTMNRGKSGNFPSSSDYKGVSWYKAGNKWGASIKHNYKKIHIGYFYSETEAALAYNLKAKELFGEFALLNEVII